jgi:hypothetical protein
MKPARITIPKETCVICIWPNGQTRDVVVISDDGVEAKIIWNESIERVYKPHKDIAGFIEVVPSRWLIKK